MAAAIQCEACGFLYGYADEGIEYTVVTCPRCTAPARRVVVDVDLVTPGTDHGESWIVASRFGRVIAGPFTSPDAAERWIVVNTMWDHPAGRLDVVRMSVNGRGSGRMARRPCTAERERVPALIDALDVQLALWIAHSMTEEGSGLV